MDSFYSIPPKSVHKQRMAIGINPIALKTLAHSLVKYYGKYYLGVPVSTKQLWNKSTK